MTIKPFFLGGLMLGSGYVWGFLQRKPRPVSQELIAFQRREQMLRLKRFLTGKGNSYNEHLPDPRKCS